MSAAEMIELRERIAALEARIVALEEHRDGKDMMAELWPAIGSIRADQPLGGAAAPADAPKPPPAHKHHR